MTQKPFITWSLGPKNLTIISPKNLRVEVMLKLKFFGYCRHPVTLPQYGSCIYVMPSVRILYITAVTTVSVITLPLRTSAKHCLGVEIIVYVNSPFHSSDISFR